MFVAVAQIGEGSKERIALSQIEARNSVEGLARLRELLGDQGIGTNLDERYEAGIRPKRCLKWGSIFLSVEETPPGTEEVPGEDCFVRALNKVRALQTQPNADRHPLTG